MSLWLHSRLTGWWQIRFRHSFPPLQLKSSIPADKEYFYSNILWLTVRMIIHSELLSACYHFIWNIFVLTFYIKNIFLSELKLVHKWIVMQEIFWFCCQFEHCTPCTFNKSVNSFGAEVQTQWVTSSHF